MFGQKSPWRYLFLSEVCCISLFLPLICKKYYACMQIPDTPCLHYLPTLKCRLGEPTFECRLGERTLVLSESIGRVYRRSWGPAAVWFKYLSHAAGKCKACITQYRFCLGTSNQIFKFLQCRLLLQVHGGNLFRWHQDLQGMEVLHLGLAADIFLMLGFFHFVSFHGITWPLIFYMFISAFLLRGLSLTVWPLVPTSGPCFDWND